MLLVELLNGAFTPGHELIFAGKQMFETGSGRRIQTLTV